MTHRPFTADNRNIFNEAIFTSAPATLGTNNVIVRQALNRSIFDQNSTSIAGNPQANIPSCCPCCYRNPTPSPQVVSAHRDYIPGGVSFTFNPMAQNYALQNFCTADPYPTAQQFYQYNEYPSSPRSEMQQYSHQPLTLEQQIALKQLERENLELMLVQEHIKKSPYKVRFHYNGQTSTTDLLAGQSQMPLSHGMTDFKNISCGMADIRKEIEEIGKTDQLPAYCPPTTLYPPVSKAKKLILTKSPDLKRLNKIPEQEEKNCSDQAVQTKRIYVRRKKKPKKSKRRSNLDNSSFSSRSDSCDCSCNCSTECDDDHDDETDDLDDDDEVDDDDDD